MIKQIDKIIAVLEQSKKPLSKKQIAEKAGIGIAQCGALMRLHTHLFTETKQVSGKAGQTPIYFSLSIHCMKDLMFKFLTITKNRTGLCY